MRLRVNIERPVMLGLSPGWWKHVTSVDLTKRDGYAFVGDFLDDGMHDLPVGAVLVLKAPTGTAAQPAYTGTVYCLQPDGHLRQGVMVHHWNRDFLQLREAVSMALVVGSRAQFATATATATATSGTPSRPAQPAQRPGFTSVEALSRASDQDLVDELRRRPDAWRLFSDMELAEVMQTRGYRI